MVESETQMQSLLQTALAKHQAQLSCKVCAIVKSVQESPSHVNRGQGPAAGDGGGCGGSRILPRYGLSLSRARALSLSLSLSLSPTHSLILYGTLLVPRYMEYKRAEWQHAWHGVTR